ncbi:MAG TPA: adenylate/guanylate cyclase domain-containing protein [Acidimicrobiia bacterium]|nr:adenylate/guanylate cyclase domain-containing protein [Acidimicrobiia bacterium]
MSLPSGVVTFVFSDIEGSTHLWETDADGMSRSLARHDLIVQEAVKRAGGVLFKHTGDGFGAAFESVTGGLNAAADVAAAFHTEKWDGPALTCRIGVHTGEAEPRDGDYFGPTVTRTARIMDAGNGGQIIVSEAARRLVGPRPPAGLTFVDAGEHRLKDLGEPIRISRLVGRGAEDQRELRTLERAPHNLPVQLSSFIGREAHIKEVVDLVRHSRLVTLTGIGGVGKTRLSLQVAAELLGDFHDGVWFVELAPLAEAGLIADTATNALAVPPDSTLPADKRLAKFLGARQALLVLDNCEHLIDDVASFVDVLLRACPDVRVLATSREGLGVSGEALWRVPSLRVDEDAAAVELFAERARLVQPGFTISEDNLAAVAELCVRLDGIPLAIELATARLKMLTVDQIAQHLGDRFRLLTGGSRTAVERQRTLRAMMDWSYDLLSDEEQALLRRLAVFYDGFTYEAAEEVCSGELLPRFAVLDLLGRLVEASVVTFEGDPRPRYRLLETVRQYALDKLVEATEADEARLRHAEFFRMASRALSAALDRDDYSVMDPTTDDLGNYRAAMTWTLESDQGPLALELACNLRMYFWNRVMYRESLRWLLASLDMVEDSDSLFVPVAAAYALTDSTNVSDVEATQVILPRVTRLYESDLDVSVRGLLANALAAHTMNSDAREADDLFRSAHELMRSAGNPRWASAVQNRFLTAWFMNSLESEAEITRLTEEAVAAGVSIHGPVIRVTFLTLAEDYDAVLDITDRHSPVDDWEEAMMLVFRAQAERATGRFDGARESLRRAAAVVGANSPGPNDWQLAMLLLQVGEVDEAASGFRQSALGGTQPTPDAYGRMNVATVWAIVASRRQSHATAAILGGFIDGVGSRSSMRLQGFDRRQLDEALEESRAALGSDEYERYHDLGQDTPWEELPLVHGDPP